MENADVSLVEGTIAFGNYWFFFRYFSVRELDEFTKRRIAAARAQTVAMKLAAFELFREGVDWRDVAIKLQCDPYRVYRLWRLYGVDQKSKD